MQESFEPLDQKEKDEFLKIAWKICLMYQGKWNDRTKSQILDMVFELSEYSDKVPFLSKKITYYDLWSFFHPKYGHSKSFKEMTRKEFEKFVEKRLLN